MDKLTLANKKLETAHDTRERDYNAEIGKLDAAEKKLLDQLKVLDEKKLKVAKANGDVDVADGDLIEINAGGKIIAITRSTLTQFKGTKLEALFSGRWEQKLQKDKEGHIFLDVNPLCFQAIVDYLYEVKISSDENPAAPPSVDAEYNGILMHQLYLFGLSEIVFPIELPDSTIIQQIERANLLHDWLDEDSSGGNLSLLYRSSRDGRNEQAFHSKCDNKGPTLTVVETSEGYITGGYSDVHWTSCGGAYASSIKAFLFAISQSDAFVPSKMKLRNGHQDCAVYNNPSYGPCFGEGHDLLVQGSDLYIFYDDNSYDLEYDSDNSYEGYITGGYSDVAWASSGGYASSNKAFLFVISQSDAFVPSKMKLKNNETRKYAVYNGSSYGPYFGYNDLYVQGSNLYINNGHSYDSSPTESGAFTIKEMEVFQVMELTGNPKPKKHGKHTENVSNNAQEVNNVQSFCTSINQAINEKWAALAELELEVVALETSFKDEEQFIKFFSSVKDQDIVSLNVCGTPMATTRQTLLCKDSALSSMALNAEEDKDKNSCKPVKEWNAEDVVAWLNTIDEITPSIVKSFEQDEVNGRQLLSLGKEGLTEFGITKKGLVFYILAEIKKLERAQGQSEVLIEHSPHCFEKIIDHLRLESAYVKGLIENKPHVPTVRASEKSRFEKVVKHYFPGASSKSLLGN